MASRSSSTSSSSFTRAPSASFQSKPTRETLVVIWKASITAGRPLWTLSSIDSSSLPFAARSCALIASQLRSTSPEVEADVVAEDVRVAADHLLRDALDDPLQAERPALLGDVGVEDDLEQQVAELAGELGVVLLVDGVGDLVGLLDRHRLDALVGLLAVPRAAAGGPQAGDQLDEAGEEQAGLGRRGGGLDPGHAGIFPSNGSAAYSSVIRIGGVQT